MPAVQNSLPLMVTQDTGPQMINHHSKHNTVQMFQSYPVLLKSQETCVLHEVMRASKESGDKSAGSDLGKSGVCLRLCECVRPIWERI